MTLIVVNLMHLAAQRGVVIQGDASKIYQKDYLQEWSFCHCRGRGINDLGTDLKNNCFYTGGY